MEFEESSGQAAFDSRAEYCKELSHLRRALHFARLENDIKKWYQLLEAYYITLYPRLKDNKKEGEKSMREKHDEYDEKARKYFNEYQEALSKGKKSVNASIFQVFRDWEKQLRLDENNVGLLMPNKDDPAYALGGKSY